MAHLRSIPATTVRSSHPSGPVGADAEATEARRFIARSLRWERLLEALRRSREVQRAAA
jgi:hypothetical protein